MGTSVAGKGGAEVAVVSGQVCAAAPPREIPAQQPANGLLSILPLLLALILTVGTLGPDGHGRYLSMDLLISPCTHPQMLVCKNQHMYLCSRWTWCCTRDGGPSPRYLSDRTSHLLPAVLSSTYRTSVNGSTRTTAGRSATTT